MISGIRQQPRRPKNNVEIMKTTHGGARPGAGKPKGVKWPSTLRKEEARELVRQMIVERLPGIITAQLDNAEGLRHLVIRDPETGQFTRVTGDAKQVDKALKSKNACTIYTKDPNVQAFTDLLNRCIDKPAEHVSIAGADGGPLVIRWQRPEDDTPGSDSNVVDLPASDVKQIPDETGFPGPDHHGVSNRDKDGENG